MVHLLDNLWQWRITLQGYYNEPLANEAAYDATELHEDAFPTLAALRERMRKRKHDPPAEQHRWLVAVLRGHYRYYAVPTNHRALAGFRGPRILGGSFAVPR